MEKITIIVRDNTDLKKCIEEQKSSLPDVTRLKFNENLENNKIDFYFGLVHFFLTKVLTKDDFLTLLTNSKWKELEDSSENILYDPEKHRLCNYIGVIEKEFEVSKRNIIDSCGLQWNTELYGNNNDNRKVSISLKLQIISRFDGMDKPYFLQTLMFKGKNLFFSNANNVSGSYDGYYDFLLLAMYKQALATATSMGYYKTYHEFSANDSRVKGRINISKHIRLNVGMKNGNIAYTYRENSLINYINMLIITAYNYLESKYPDLVRNLFDSEYGLLEVLDVIKYSIEDHMCDIGTLISKTLSPVSHPYYSDYEYLRTVCLRILRNEGMGFEDDTQLAQGIIYYIPDLWEEFLLDYLESPDYHIKYQDIQYIFEYSNEGFKTKIKPDFVFCSKDHDSDHLDESPFMILDAKFKREWWNRIKQKITLGQINHTSLMPDYDECIRYLNTYNVNATGVVFPVGNVDEDHTNDISEYLKNYGLESKHSISKYNTRDHFYTFPIFVPSVEESYEKWYEQFESLNENVKKHIISTIKEEQQNFKKQ